MTAPVMETPVMTTPVMETPVMTAPVMETPVMTAPVMDAPMMDAPMMDAPAMDAPMMDTPAMDAPMMDAPAMDAPMMDAPMMDAPMMDAPAMDAPMMDAPMMDAPVMAAPVMNTPIMPASEPAFNNASYNPAGQYGYNNMPNVAPNNAPINNKPKKSKAPIFIGLGIGVLVIAIIALVIFLVLPGDKKKKDKDDKTTTAIETTTEEVTTEEPTTEEPTTEEPTTEEPTTEEPTVDVMDFDDAETLLIKFLNAADDSNFSKASNYIYPPVLEYCETQGISAEVITAAFVSDFLNENGELLDYSVSAVYLTDSTTYDDFFYGTVGAGFVVEDCASYIEPYGFAIADVDFTYNGQTGTVKFYFVYGMDSEFYIFDYDDTDFDIEVGTGTVEEEFDFDKALAENYYSYSWPIDGTLTTFDGYTLIIPEGWVQDIDGFYDAEYANCAGVITDTLNGATLVDYLRTSCEETIASGAENFEFGNLTVDAKTGYYVEFDYIDKHYLFMIFANEATGTVYLSQAVTNDVESENFEIAVAIAASIEIQ